MKTFLSFLFVAFFISPLGAQEDFVNTRLLVVGVTGGVEGLYYKSGSDIVEIQASMTGLSSGTKYKGPAFLALYDSPDAFTPPPEGEEPPKPVAVVRLPKGEDRIVLLVIPGKDGKKPKIRAYPASTDKLKPGDYRFFNFATSSIGVVIGDEKFGIKPNKVRTVKGSWKKDENFDMPVQILQVMKDSKPIPVYSQIWGHQKAKRNFIMVFDGSKAGSPLDVRRFYDVPRAEKREESAGDQAP